ncbi:MAG: alpha/beta hydrolase [Nitrospirales bacterium]|nr:MAG: alpha/beta hydrolase [Nitrospirales bacterium]
MPPNPTILFFQDSNHRKISAILTEPESPTDRIVILCHGFLSNKHSSTNRRLTELLIDQEISTFCFDWFGMGESDGAFTDLSVDICCDELEQAVALVRTQGYSRIGLVGSSYGGLIATLIASRDASLAVLGLKCPVPDFPEMLQLEFGQEAMTRWQTTGEIPDVTGSNKPIELRYAFYENCLTYDAYTAAKTIHMPTLIVHGDADELVPLQQIERLEQSLAGEKILHLLPGANHHFGKPDDFRKMTTLLADWMALHLST